MKITKKIIVLSLIFSFFASTTPAHAEDALQRTLTDSLYGGIIGALLGSAIAVLNKHPEDHLDYIPTGAAIGVLAGATWGIATSSGVVQSLSEVENNKLTFNFPTIKNNVETDKRTNRSETVESLELFKLKF